MGAKIKAMDLRERINAAGQRAVDKQISSGPRSWRTEMAAAAGCSYQNIAQAASGKQDKMDAAYLRKIAVWAQVNEQWMVYGIGQMADDQPQSSTQHYGTSESTPFTDYLYSDTKLILAPVIEWASLETELYKDNKEVIASRFEAIPAGSRPNTKWVEVEADMPRLMLSRGDLVLITPVSGQHECKESKMHLFKTIGGAYFLGTFRRLASGFEAIPDSGPALESEKHGVQVVGIKHGHIEVL